MILACEAKKIMDEVNNRIQIEKAVNDRIIAAAKLGRGHIEVSSSELTSIKDILTRDGYTIAGQDVIWDCDDIVAIPEEEEDEWS